jgi:hypothetical protein
VEFAKQVGVAAAKIGFYEACDEDAYRILSTPG